MTDGATAGANPTVPFAGMIGYGSSVSGAPKAYLNMLVLDRNKKYLGSSFVQVGTSASEDGSDVPHQYLRISPVTITEAGFVYIYLSNGTGSRLEVFFDDFKVVHAPGIVVQKDDYYPFGMSFSSYQRPGAVDQNYLYNGKELIEDHGLQYYDYGARMYDAAIGRFSTVDPLADHPNQVSSSPYNYGANNPVFHTDPDGKCPPWICGAIIGAALDYGLQVTENILRNDGQVTLEAFTDVDGTSITASALTGATGAGLVTKLKKAHTLVRLGVEVASDGGSSAINQFVNEGEVDLYDVAIDATAGQIVGKGVSKSLKGQAQNTSFGRALKRDADRAQRVADQPKRSSGRQQAKQQKANTAIDKSDSYGDSRAAAAGASSAGAASYIVKKVKEEDENQ